MLVSIIIPAYKKEKTIEQDIKRIYDAISSTKYDFELIVVVDGQLDKTEQIAKKYIKKNSSLKEKVHIYSYKTNRGKGYAVRYGMARSKGAFVSFMDAGLKIDASSLTLILAHMEWYDADIMVGSKRHPASKVNFTPLRKVYSLIYQLIVLVLFRLKIRDTQVGLKVFKRKVLEKVLPRLMVKMYAFDVEVLAVANYLGFTKIYESPVELDFNVQGGSTRFTAFAIFDPFVRGMILDTLAIFYRMYILHFYDERNRQKWTFDKELQMRVNTGELREKK